jgi:hypothetical protein
VLKTGGKIPGGATLVFDVECLKINGKGAEDIAKEANKDEL